MQGWQVPALHVDLCHWLEQHEREPLTLVMVFRGAAKSTIVSVFKAWQLRKRPAGIHQVWGADKKVAAKMGRYTRFVLARHPWCAGMVDPRAPVNGFWVSGSKDARNPSMEAVGVDSSATGSRSTDTTFDDIEVPRNIRTPAKRESLRDKIDEAIHILVPGGQRMYIGTPHTFETIYRDVQQEGAATFKRPLFAKHVRHIESSTITRYPVPFKPGDDGLYVFIGVHRHARLLREGRDYEYDGEAILFAEPPKAAIDIYAHNEWPERFDRKDLLTRRKACRTINTWDSQYQLEARAVTETRLDPDRMTVYEDEPRIEWRNKHPVMMLGKARIAGFVVYWDVSLGKVKSDASAVAVMLTDHAGNLYWHRAVALTGELETIDERTGRLVDGQVFQLIRLLRDLSMHHVYVEVNGPGGFVPGILTKHAKPHGIGVTERFVTANKQRRILDAFEAPLSSRFLWCHETVVESPAFAQLREFNPALTDQPDDYIDAGAGAILETPVRLERIVAPDGVQPVVQATRPRQSASVELDFD